MFTFLYTTTINKILLFMLIVYIFFVCLLGSLETYLLLSITCLLLFNGYKINSVYIWKFSPYRYYCYIMIFLIVHFLLVPFKNVSFLLGTLTTFLIGIALIQKIEYRIVEKWIIILGFVQLFFGLWSFFSFSSLTLLCQYILPSSVLSEMKAFHSEGRNTGINSQTSLLAFYLVQLIGVLFIKYKDKINFKFIFLIIIILLILVTTNRRGALVFTFIGVFSCWIMVKKYSFAKLIISGVIALVSLFFIIQGLGKLGFSSQIFDRFNVFAIDLSDYNSVNELASSRLSLIVHAFDFYSERPILGQGFKFFFEERGQDVHNTYLQLLCESGIMGTTIMLLFFLSNIIRTISMAKRYENIPKDILYSFYIQFFFLIMCFIENPFSDRYFILSYVIAISLMYNRLFKEREQTVLLICNDHNH